MKLFKQKKKDFTKELLKSVRKTQVGNLATKFLLQFMPDESRRKTPVFKPKEKRVRKFPGHKAATMASDGKIGLSHRHGIVGQAMANMKRDRILAERANKA